MAEHPTHRHPELPLDPDTAADGPPGDGAPQSYQVPYRDPRALALVFLGGTLGTGSREALSLAIPPVDDVAWTVVGINVVGAFVLGLLLESLARRGADQGRNRRLRLLLGTGFLGGFTTYSTLATQTAVLLSDGRAVAGLAFALTTLLVGAAATWCGIAAGARR